MHTCAGVVMLDLDQKTLPGIAHQVVEQMIISDQIRAEDRSNVLRALLLKHRSGILKMDLYFRARPEFCTPSSLRHSDSNPKVVGSSP